MDTSQKTSEETLPAGGVVSGTAGDAARDAAAATLRTQLNHRTIRDFDGRPLGPESAVESLREYDAAIAPWVDIRYGKPVGPFTEYVPTRLSGSVARRGRLLAAIGAQGFDVALPAEK